MTHSVDFSNKKPPMTPRINKRLAPAITPKSQSTIRRRTMTLTTPRCLYPNNIPIGSYSTLSTMTPSTGDRFIPNRSRTDVTKAQRALRPQQPKRQRQQSNLESDARLRRVLFSNSDTTSSMMSFGLSSGKKETKECFPFAQDILRPGLAGELQSIIGPTTSGHRDHAVEIRWTNCLDAPGILGHHDLTLVSCHKDVLACALGEKIYLWKEGETAELLDESDSPYTCVQFSDDGKYLALGQDGILLIYRIDWIDGHYIERELFHIDGYVTAIAWHNGSSSIVACGEDGIKSIDLDQPTVGADFTYGALLEATTLVWNSQNNIIVAANREEDSIQIFDNHHARYQLESANNNNIAPRLSLHHDDVRCIEFSPLQPNLLASGGNDSVKFWNVRNGTMRGEIKTDSPVAGIVFSKTENEVIIADEGRVAVYSLCPKVTMLAERKIAGKKMTSMTAGVNGKLFVVGMQSGGEDSLLVLTVTRKATRAGKRKIVIQSELGTLQMPVIR